MSGLLVDAASYALVRRNNVAQGPKNSSLNGRPPNQIAVMLVVCDSKSIATVVLLKDLGAGGLESQQDRKPDPVRSPSP
jgi:hypothetical protein